MTHINEIMVEVTIEKEMKVTTGKRDKALC